MAHSIVPQPAPENNRREISYDRLVALGLIAPASEIAARRPSTLDQMFTAMPVAAGLFSGQRKVQS